MKSAKAVLSQAFKWLKVFILIMVGGSKHVASILVSQFTIINLNCFNPKRVIC